MNRHLSTQEFVDAVDLVLPADRLAHVTSCTTCRAEVEALRAVLVDVSRDGDVPEPSPLFWNHFQSRVQAELRSQAAVPSEKAWKTMFGSVRTFLAAGATVAAAVIGVALYTGESASPGSAVTVAGGELIDTAMPEDGATALDGAEWGFVTDVIGTLKQDDVRDVLAPSRHAMDSAFDGLSTAERDAFMKLVTAEMAEGME